MQNILKLFPAFHSRNYRLYFIGQLISLIGTWLQVVAEGWLVLTLTNSALLIGMVAVCATVPTLVFSLFGGVVVDRFSKRKILLITQTLSMILAFIYGILTVLHVINIWEIMALALLLGVVTAIDLPARQAFTVELVGKEHLSSAITINSAMFNGARVIGPGLAGVLIALFGPGGAFLVNATSYIAGIVVTYLVKIQEKRQEVHPHPIKAIKEGLSYTFKHSTIRALIMLTGVISIFGWSYSTIMPYIAKNTLHVDAAGLGYLYAIAGLGALVSAFIVPYAAKKVSYEVLITCGVLLFSVSIFGFTFANTVVVAVPFLFLSGVGLLSSFASVNTTIQHEVEDKFRGRVLSIYILAFLGLFPLGNLWIGLMSEKAGPHDTIRLGAAIVLIAALIFYFTNQKKKKIEEIVAPSQLTPEPVLEQSEW